MTDRATAITEITNDPRDYAWGTIDGVARVLGRPGTAGPEAELWLGAHPTSPSRSVGSSAGWPDLAAWEAESGTRLPYLLKILCASSPLSLQAHPTTEQAGAGFAREEALGLPVDARERNYRDPYAKPELVVALADGFEALCGFRPVADSLTEIDALATAIPRGAGASALASWRDRLACEGGVRAAFSWLLSGAPEVVEVVEAVTDAADAAPARFELAARLAAAYPGDPGIAIAQMLNHVVLRAGESLWLPAGNIHAYLRGDGVELMGPSDNVLRGGLTPKHVDTAELSTVVDFGDAPARLLEPVPVTPGVRSYRPRAVPSGRDVPFELLALEGDSRLELHGPSIVAVTDGTFAIEVVGVRRTAPRGTALFVDGPADASVTGAGRMWVATAASSPQPPGVY